MNERLASLPDPLVAESGDQITASQEWEQYRRQEIVELFRDNVYGREPVQRPESLRFQTISSDVVMDGLATRKLVTITFSGPGGEGNIRVLLFVPNQTVKPVPAFMLIDNRGASFFDPDRPVDSEFWPVEYILSRGYATAVYQTEDLDPDHHDGFRNGVHGVFDVPGQPRSDDAWATIAAWAWGASRVMDYLEKEPAIDSRRVALVGHSRGGKTSLWAGAADERFAMVVSNNSGSTGAAISRGKIGEKIRNINTSFPHWFCENYKSFNDKEDELPVDQHMLLALIAPRLLYVTSASEDTWADPQSEFLAVKLAEPVYRLYGFTGLDTDQFPNADCPVYSERMGYHVRTGRHDLLHFDWKCFMDFADQHL